MSMQTIRFMALLVVLVALPARAWVTTPALDPVHPKEGQTVFVTFSSGYCDGFGEFSVTTKGNQVHFNIFSALATDLEACFYPVQDQRYPLGRYASGRYEVLVDRTYIGDNGLETHPMGIFNMLVEPAPGTSSIPALGKGELVGLAFGLALVGFLRRREVLLLVVPLPLFLFPTGAAHADTTPPTIEFVLSSAPGTPTPMQVVDQFRQSSPGDPPPIPGLASANPANVTYLMPLRATGDFLSWMLANPQTSRARLERYLVVQYPSGTNLDEPLAALHADPNVIGAGIVVDAGFSSVTSGTGLSERHPFFVADYLQYGWYDLNIPGAWQLAGGNALVGDVDSGLSVLHPSLRQFDESGNYVEGNFVPASSLDIGESYTLNPPSKISLDVDEARPIQTAIAACDPGQTGYATPYFAGHGTHTAGLIAANPLGNVRGACKHCGIAMWKVINYLCNVPTGHLSGSINNPALGAAIAYLGDSGAQVINMSFGSQSKGGGWCASRTEKNPDSWCDAIAYVHSREITLVGASGNQRDVLQFPANDERVISVGGLDSSKSLWDDSPGSVSNCPVAQYLLPGRECGSNYSKDLSGPRQELMASSKNVLSTTYPGKDWNPELACGDSFGPGGGYGLCTGTSMAAPQIAGLVGILRSINPLAVNGNPGFAFGNVSRLRTVLTQHAWEQRLGYGIPDGALAAERMLGHVAGSVVRNRVTPLFRLYSAGARDYLDTVSPQFAIAAMINQNDAYAPQGALIPGYPAFPQDDSAAPFPVPRANVYVLTTEFGPRPSWPDLVPLYMMERTRPFPPGCSGSPPACNPNNRDFTLLTTATQLEQAHADGYSLRTIQGYVYQPCTPEPSCIPTGAQKFYRECKSADDDCATFVEGERAGFEAAGYVVAYPAGVSKVMGYAYPATDSDTDGLIDGFEYVVGTRPDNPDSDADGSSDAAEFPVVGVAVSDPCSSSCQDDVIFNDGFQ